MPMNQWLIAEPLQIDRNDVSFGPPARSSSYQLVVNPLANGAIVNVMGHWTQASGRDAIGATAFVANSTPSGVRQAALIGVTDAILCMRLVAFLTLKDGVTFNAAAAKSAIADHMTYDLATLSIKVTDEFPMTLTGKIAKGELAARYAEAA